MSEYLARIEELQPNDLLPDTADIQRLLLSVQSAQTYNPDNKDIYQQQAAIYQDMHNILKALSSNWIENHPGKYRPHYSLLNKSGREVIARELLDIGAEDNVPPHKRVVNLDRVAKHQCPACGKDKAIIRKYQQLTNVYGHDQWKMTN